jgi:hypothetical protein
MTRDVTRFLQYWGFDDVKLLYLSTKFPSTGLALFDVYTIYRYNKPAIFNLRRIFQ